MGTSDLSNQDIPSSRLIGRVIADAHPNSFPISEIGQEAQTKGKQFLAVPEADAREGGAVVSMHSPGSAMGGIEAGYQLATRCDSSGVLYG